MQSLAEAKEKHRLFQGNYELLGREKKDLEDELSFKDKQLEDQASKYQE